MSEFAPPTGPGSEALYLEEAERQAIIKALEQSRGVQARAARLLGISRRTIHSAIKKYGIQVTRIQAGQ